MSWTRAEPPVFDPWSADDLRELLDALPSLVAYVDPDGVNRYVNAAAERWSSRRVEEVVGAEARELLGEDAFRAVEPWVRRAAEGDRQGFQRVDRIANGEVRYALSEYVPRVREGRAAGFFVMATDVSPWVRAESAHVEGAVRRARSEQRNLQAAATSDEVLQSLFGIGLQLDRLQRRALLGSGEVEPVLASLQETITRLRSLISLLVLTGDRSSTVGVVGQLISDWAERTGGPLPALAVDPGVEELAPGPARLLLSALSQILGTVARHGSGPFRVHVGVDGPVAFIEAEAEDWPEVLRSELDRMAALVREDGSTLELDTSHPVVTRVRWSRPATESPDESRDEPGDQGPAR